MATTRHGSTFAERKQLALTIKSNAAVRNWSKGGNGDHKRKRKRTRTRTRTRTPNKAQPEKHAPPSSETTAAAASSTLLSSTDDGALVVRKLGQLMVADKRRVVAQYRRKGDLVRRRDALVAEAAAPRERWEGHRRTEVQQQLRAVNDELHAAVVCGPRNYERRKRLFHILTRAASANARGQASRAAAQSSWAVRVHAPKQAPGTSATDTGTAALTTLNDLLTFALARSVSGVSAGSLLTNGAVCPRCRGQMESGIGCRIVCPRCKIILDADVMVAAGMATQEGGNTQTQASSASQYKSAGHFMNRVMGVQARRLWRIKPSVFLSLCKYVHKFQIPRRDLTNVWVGREMLAATGNRKLYEHVQLVLSHLSGVRPPQIPPVLHNEFNILIRMVHRAWKDVQRTLDGWSARQSKLEGKGLKVQKRNNPNAGFCFNHLARLLGYPELQQHNWAIWDPANVEAKDNIMKIIFEQHGWEFTATKIDRMAGPAKDAVQRRQNAFTAIQATLAHGAGGANADAARAMGAESWRTVTDVVLALTYYEYVLSRYDMRQEDPGRVAAALRIANDFSLAHVPMYIQKQMQAVESAAGTPPRS